MVHEIRDYSFDSFGIIKSLNFNSKINQTSPLSQRWPALNSILDSVENFNNEQTETIMFSLTTSLVYDLVDLNADDSMNDEELGEYYVWVFAFYHNNYYIHLYRAFNLLASDAFFYGQFLYIFDHQYVYVLSKRSKYSNILQLEQIRRYSQYPIIFEQGSILYKN
ncbi:hypothetical protein BLA29_006632 [Euroglyphus maynei]|uniref:Uncharacterized protein n=1 Tax=Euroglyphus maynei TaxID=6958 RepID=A0A1Y3B365_EURMA|nr:hypothetical protein BLA29_006632 [Euroglyphus maynei]